LCSEPKKKGDRLYYLVDLKRTIETGAIAFWKNHKSGYTYKVEFAGIYNKEIACEICQYDLEESTIKVPVHLVQKIKEDILKLEKRNQEE
jgi:hypothetical protein